MTNINYPVGDFLIRVKNAVLSGKREIIVSETKLIKSVAKVLKKQGFFNEVTTKSGKITAKLNYHKKKPVLINLRLISKPGLRVYKGADELEKRRKPSFYLVSTPKGIMTSMEAVKKRLGGEIIVEIW
jgi:small subunit ribosomal protein S8